MGTGGEHKMNKKIRFMITILILVFLFWKISLAEVLSILEKTNLLYLLLTTPLISSLYVIRTLKWEIMLRAVHIETHFIRDMIYLLKGMFYGLATPGRAGELGRALFFEQKPAVFATVVWEKITDVMVLLVLSMISLLFFFTDPFLFWLTVALGIIIFGMTVILIHTKTILYLTSLFMIPTGSSQEYLTYTRRCAYDLKLNLWLFALTMFYYTICFVIGYIVLYAIQPALSPLLIFSLPLIILLGNIPITLSGIGIREAVTSIAFHSLGAEAVYGASYAFLLFFLITVIPGLVGGVLHQYEK